MKAKALSAVATALLLAVMAVALPFSVPKLFGYQIYNVLTQSMEPAMPSEIVEHQKILIY